jgi:nucleoside-diphosphate kinase
MVDRCAEKTLVLFKPDVVQRQIVGEFITRFERKGFKIVGMKMIWPTKKLVGLHYAEEKEYLIEVGKKTIKSALERNEKMKESDPLKVGKKIREWNMEYLSCGPILAIVLEGASVIESVRKMIGSTNPITADIGTIRADYSPDSYMLANIQGRNTRTLLHASDSSKSAKREIPLWFKKGELYKYSVGIEHILYDAGWSEEHH